MRELRYFPLWRGIGWLLVILIIYLSLTPKPITIDVSYGDKWGHLLAYGLLMGWFVQLYQSRKALITVASLFIAMGVGLEILQGYTGRYFEYADMVANTLGVLLGMSLLYTPFRKSLLWFESRFMVKG